MKTHTILLALALTLPAGVATAQSPDGRPPGPRHEGDRQSDHSRGDRREGPPPSPGDRPPGGPSRADKPMPPPVFAVLDRNRDGRISREELGHASEALRRLDGNHDGNLTVAEMMAPPMRSGRPGGDRSSMPPAGAPRDGGPHGKFGPPPGGPREGDRPGRFGPPPSGPRDGTQRRESDRSRDDGPRRETNRGPRDGERRPEGDRPRDGDRRPEGDRPRDGERRPEDDRPRDEERRPEGDQPRNGATNR